MADIVDVNQLPTLSDLYQAKKLDLTTTPAAPPSKVLNDKIVLFRGDITKLKADAIVNAANTSLLGGGGVDGAIHQAAGPRLKEACIPLRGCATGRSKITDGFNLPAAKVIHTVGPNCTAPGMSLAKAEPLLESCYRTALRLAIDHQCKSIVFSCISTGVYGFPRDNAAAIAIDTVRDILSGPEEDKLDKVVFCLFLEPDVDVYNETLPQFFPPPLQEGV